MATMMAPLGATVSNAAESSLTAAPTLIDTPTTEVAREVLKCEHCKLVQFRTASDSCRRCKKSLLPEQPKAVAAISLVPEPVAAPAEGIQVACAVRDLRHVRNLSQRQLAARMGV